MNDAGGFAAHARWRPQGHLANALGKPDADHLPSISELRRVTACALDYLAYGLFSGGANWRGGADFAATGCLSTGCFWAVGSDGGSGAAGPL
jgi:hypothetical protein